MKKSSGKMASSGPVRSEDHPGTPRLFEPGSWNPIAQGTGPFYFPDGKARFNVAQYAPPAEDVDAEYPIILDHRPCDQPVPSGTQTRRIGPLLDPLSRAARRDPSAWPKN